MRRIESTFSKLDKILTLEQRKGFQDQAVMGGLEPFLIRWTQESKEESGPDQYRRIEDLVALFKGYSLADSGARQDVVAEVKTRLAQMNAEGLWKGRVLPPRPDSEAPDAGAQRPQKAAEPPREAEKPIAPPPAPSPPPVVREAAPAPRPRLATVGLDSPVSVMTGVSGVYASRLARLGVQTIKDLLYLFPRRYNDYSAMRKVSALKVGELETIAGTVWEISSVTTRRGLIRTTAIVGDETGTIDAVWFNQPYIAQTLTKGRQVVLSGKVDVYLGRPIFPSPEYELLETEDLIHTGRLVPVYPLTEGLGARWLRRLQKKVLDRWLPEVIDHLPATVRQQATLQDLPIALGQIHFPDNPQLLEQARRRLAFDEFFLIQLGLLLRRRDWRETQVGNALQVEQGLVKSFLATLPFALTGGQHRALNEILIDMGQPAPMARLLQGEVGSGKTVVAAAAMRVALANGFQAAIMAPTEILAEQHYKTMSQLLGKNGALPAAATNNHRPVAVRLLTGSLKESEKVKTRAEIAAGQVDVVIGTQAIIQESVEFAKLGLVVIDEQHRFGVMQRAALRQKGFSPHVLVMTATPIPRTLALTIYGDLDISVIDELPPGRQEIKTRWLDPTERERAYNFIRRQATEGRQTFVICPLVEESEVLEVKAATEEYERLKTEIFADLRLGLLHGRMKPQEKDAVMRAFRAQEIDILVSTPVVEVGIDIPNATVMLIEGADRFGLSQLHQFRGRVGRGEHQSYCLLLSDKPSEEARKRLGVIETTQNGFLLAEEDLKLRGPGEFFGVRQSGLPDLKVARLSDTAILEQARAEAQQLFKQDNRLEQPEHRLLQQKVAQFWQAEGDVS